MSAQDQAPAPPPTGTIKMIANLIKVALIAGAVLLCACSGVSTDHRYADDAQFSNGFGPGPIPRCGSFLP